MFVGHVVKDCLIEIMSINEVMNECEYVLILTFILADTTRTRDRQRRSK